MTTTAVAKRDGDAQLVDMQTTRRFLGGVSRRTVERLIERGTLKRAHVGGLRRVLIRREDLEKLARAK